MRPATGDELDRFLDGVEDEMGGWASVVNKNEQEVKTLTEDELNLIQRLARAENPDESYDPYVCALLLQRPRMLTRLSLAQLRPDDPVLHIAGHGHAALSPARAQVALPPVQVGAQEGDEDRARDPRRAHHASPTWRAQAAREAALLRALVRRR
jgi:hypothetical protein